MRCSESTQHFFFPKFFPKRKRLKLEKGTSSHPVSVFNETRVGLKTISYQVTCKRPKGRLEETRRETERQQEIESRRTK
jgi:hypothetical protein